MLASRLLKEGNEEANHGPAFLRAIGRGLANFYRRSLRFSLSAPFLIVLAAVIFAGASYVGYGLIREELTPIEDRAVALMRINGPQGISVEFLQQQLDKIETAIEPMRESGEIRSTYAIAGSGGASNNGFMVLTLAPWKERERSQQEIIADISSRVEDIAAVRIFTMQPNSIGIRGAGSGLQFAVVGNDYERIGPAADAIVSALEKDPRFEQPRLSVEPTQPLLSVEINRERASDLGI